MEEDIDRIEDLIFEMKTMGLTKQTLECAYSLENLIKGYRELEDKLMYALSPTSHELALNTQENFKKIIRENMDKDTYTIREKLKDYWEGDASKWVI